MNAKTPVALFVYGTLLSDEIVERVAGRVPESSPAVLSGYACYFVEGATFPGIIREKGGVVQGRVFTDLSEAEVGRLDAYEDEFYDRLEVEVSVDGDKQRAQAYVVPEEARALLSSRVWTWDDFERDLLQDYRKRLG